jgi:hypothetical protein
MSREPKTGLSSKTLSLGIKSGFFVFGGTSGSCTFGAVLSVEGVGSGGGGGYTPPVTTTFGVGVGSGVNTADLLAASSSRIPFRGSLYSCFFFGSRKLVKVWNLSRREMRRFVGSSGLSATLGSLEALPITLTIRSLGYP